MLQFMSEIPEEKETAFRKETALFIREFIKVTYQGQNSHLLQLYIQRMLRQFHLTGLFEVGYILNEVFLRGLNFTRNGREISNLEGWIKVAALNVIRELKRREDKTTLLDLEIFDPPDPASIPSDFDETDSWLVRRALDFLQPEDQEILKLVFFEKLSYQEIQRQLLSEGRDISMSSLRKRKERALKRLQETYFSQKYLQQDP